MAKSTIQATDETDISEITISPDGRVFVFGASKPLLDLFAELGWRDEIEEPTIAAKVTRSVSESECSETPHNS